MFRPKSGGAITDGISVVFLWKNPVTSYIICTDAEHKLSMHICSKTKQSYIHKDKKLLQAGGIRCDIFCLVMWELFFSLIMAQTLATKGNVTKSSETVLVLLAVSVPFSMWTGLCLVYVVIVSPLFH